VRDRCTRTCSYKREGKTSPDAKDRNSIQVEIGTICRCKEDEREKRSERDGRRGKNGLCKSSRGDTSSLSKKKEGLVNPIIEEAVGAGGKSFEKKKGEGNPTIGRRTRPWREKR